MYKQFFTFFAFIFCVTSSFSSFSDRVVPKHDDQIKQTVKKPKTNKKESSLTTDSLDSKDEQVPASMTRTSGTKRSLETRVRYIVERMFGMKFPKMKPKWLVNPKTGKCLEIDCYCESRRLGFE